jgi:signal transduction histidine kinase
MNKENYEQKPAESQENTSGLSQKPEALNQTDVLRQQVSKIAHDMNNSLTAILGYSQLLLGSDIPPDVRKKLEAISKEAQRIAKLVKDLPRANVSS